MIPEIKSVNGIDTLYVDGQPFFMLAGEIHNSSASNLDYMEEHVWKNLQGLNMNSVIVPLYWELIEPTEGTYDFSIVDGIINQARSHNMKLCFLWFGLWKNAESFYVPAWMKRDTKTYFRAEKVTGEKLNTISPLCEAAVEKDAKAFTEVMKFIRDCDKDEHTVIVMQVENEIGLLGTERDYSPVANEAFEQTIPHELAVALQLSERTWTETFATYAEEAFMAYYFAKAVDKIAFSGRLEYPLPCYVNAWLRQYPWNAGSYPSGGPIVEMHKIWKAIAPSLFTLAPDIYVPYVPDIMDEYHYAGNPLFIPEVRKDSITASYCMYAFGKHNAICYSPFGIEELALDPDAIDKPPMEVMIALNIDPSAFDITGSKEYLAATYKLIDNLKPLLLKYRGTNHLRAFVKHNETDYGTFIPFENYNLKVAYAPRTPSKPVASGMIFELEANKFLAIGMQANLTFLPKPGENLKVNFIRFEEGNIVEGEFESIRINNGDETMSIGLHDMPTCYLIELYKY